MGNDRDEAAEGEGPNDTTGDASDQNGESSQPAKAAAPAEGSGLDEENNSCNTCTDEQGDAALMEPQPPSDTEEGSPPSSPNTSDSNTPPVDIDALLAENASLRLELKEAREKLRRAEGGVPFSKREPGNGGVAYARMRRLLLKDASFLRNTLMPFLNIEDLGR